MFISWGKRRIFLYNDAYAPFLGEKHPKSFGRSFDENWSEIWDEIRPLVERVDKGESLYLEDRRLMMHRHKLGQIEETFFTFAYSPIRSDSSEVCGLYCAVVENTGRVVAERRLKENQERLRATFDYTSIGVALINLRGEFVEVNPAFQQMFGYNSKELLSLSLSKVTFPDDLSSTLSNLNRLIAGEVPAFKLEKRYFKKDGSSFWAQSTTSQHRCRG